MILKVFYILLLISGSIVVINGDAVAADQKATPAAIELHNRLVQKIDSLDIVKQRLKRSGESIEDIEIQQSLYTDSLQALKQSIQSGLHQPPGKEPIRLPFSIPDFVNPQSSLDWIILITSTIAVLSFIFMIIAIIRTRRKTGIIQKNNSKRLKPATVRQTPIAPSATGRDQSQPALPQINPLDQIKKKMHEASDYYEKTEPPRPPTQRLRAINSVENEDLETLVYKEYLRGVDIHEISKIFQISADHVSLLLKIKGVDLKKGTSK